MCAAELCLHHRAICFNARRRFSHSNFLRLIANLQRGIDATRLRHGYIDVLLRELLKTRRGIVTV